MIDLTKVPLDGAILHCASCMAPSNTVIYEISWQDSIDPSTMVLLCINCLKELNSKISEVIEK